MRRVATSNEFFDILDKIGNGKFVTIGYVTGANLDVPMVKRKNPETNRMKGYPDYSVFGGEGEGEIGALVQITSYNMQYLNRQTVNDKYVEYKKAANVIKGNFGLDPIKDREGYKTGTSWSPNGPELYNGKNDELKSHSYNPQNMFNVKPKSVVYAVDTEGHIMKELSKEQIKPYLKAKREIDGVAALRKMGAEEERIQDYIRQMNGLKFKYKNFESNSILWIAATINGEKIVYINDNLQRAVNEINIRPEDFRAIARERYQIDLASLHEMQRHIGKMINEGEWQTFQHASELAKDKSEDPNVGVSERQRRKIQADKLKKYADDVCKKKHGVDKIREKEKAHKESGKIGDYQPTQGELRNLQKWMDDSYEYFRGKQEYKNGKWVNKANENKLNAMDGKNVLRLSENELKGMIRESVERCIKKRFMGLNEALVNGEPSIVAKVRELIDRANEAYHQANEKQGGTDWPLMDRHGNIYGLSSDIKLDKRGYITIPFNGFKYSEYSTPVKIRILQKVGGVVKIIQGDMWNEGWKDARKLLNNIIKDAQIGNGYFENYDPNWESSDTPEEFKANQSSLKAMNKQIGRNASTRMDYITKIY